MTTPIRIRNNSTDHFVHIEEIQISNDGKTHDHISTYHVAPGEEYIVYAYAYRYFRIVEGEKKDGG